MENDFYVLLKNRWNFSPTALMPSSENNNCKSSNYWRFISFRILICELIYKAVNMFPEIEEYNITCTSGKSVSIIQLGTYPNNVVARLSMGDCFCDILKTDIIKIYMANRIPDPNNDRLDTIMQILYYSGKYEPSISTSMVFSNKKMDKF
jgi:hypothetical protein